MKVLHLTLKKQWFDMIASGEKKEEYRELKDYWGFRLCYRMRVPSAGFLTKWMMLREGIMECLENDFMPNFNAYDIVRFKNGFTKNAPQMDVEFKGIRIGKPVSGLSEEGYLDKDVFIIELGKILSIKNYNQ